LPGADVVFDALSFALVVDLSATTELSLVVLALDDGVAVCSTFVCFRVVVSAAELLLEASTRRELASAAVLAVLVL